VLGSAGVSLPFSLISKSIVINSIYPIYKIQINFEYVADEFWAAAYPIFGATYGDF